MQRGIQITFITAVPFHVSQSVPVGAMLAKPVPILGEWAGLTALAAGPVWVLLAVAHWKYATNKYQGGGG
ncbi:hypothetical protein HGP14_29250 [Rhizobium sp. P32RR-XVIII]|nr:hypothetical protein [Rhizobium sp. P32RR-XVIII]